jgi:hypothetical protein
MLRGQRGGYPTVVNLSFVDRSHYFSFKLLLIYPHEADWTPVQTHCYAESLVAPEIEPRTSRFALDYYTTEAVPYMHTEIAYIYIYIYIYQVTNAAAKDSWCSVLASHNWSSSKI